MPGKDETEILGESLPFEERIELPNWVYRRVDLKTYQASHDSSVKNSSSEWGRIASELDWLRPWDQIVSEGDHPYVKKWFAGGALNISQLALDRHVRGPRRNKVALMWEGERLGSDGLPVEVRKLTYFDLWRQVNRFAFLLRNKFGMKKG